MSWMTVGTGDVRDQLSSPEARRHRVRAWRDPRLVVGVALVACSGLLGLTLLGGDEELVGVWAAPTALTEGHRLSADDLVRQEVRFADRAAADRYLSADGPLPAARVLSRSIGAGELVPRAALAVDPAEQLLEVPLSVPVDAVPSTTRVGARVDVWVTPGPGASPAAPGARESESVLVLDGVRVVELPRTGGLGSGGSRQVVVALEASRETDLSWALARIARGAVVLVRTP